MKYFFVHSIYCRRYTIVLLFRSLVCLIGNCEQQMIAFYVIELLLIFTEQNNPSLRLRPPNRAGSFRKTLEIAKTQKQYSGRTLSGFFQQIRANVLCFSAGTDQKSSKKTLNPDPCQLMGSYGIRYRILTPGFT